MSMSKYVAPVSIYARSVDQRSTPIRKVCDEFAYVTAVTKETAPLSNSLLIRHSDEIAPARLAGACGGLNCRECLRRGAPKMLGVVPRLRVGRAT
jgi:hypothetical protein